MHILPKLAGFYLSPKYGSTSRLLRFSQAWKGDAPLHFVSNSCTSVQVLEKVMSSQFKFPSSAVLVLCALEGIGDRTAERVAWLSEHPAVSQ